MSIDSGDRRIQWSLKRNALSYDSVLDRGRVITLLGNANLSSGGDMIDVTEKIHSSYVEVARKCVYDMGLRLCGLDMLIMGDCSEKYPYTIIEVNAGPGLANYASLGDMQYSRVEAMYRKVFDLLVGSATFVQ